MFSKKKEEPISETREITYAELFQQSKDIEMFRGRFPGLANAFHHQIEAFIGKNRTAFDYLSNTMEKIYRTNLKYDGNGKPVIRTIQPPKIFDKNHQPVPQATKKDYEYLSDIHKAQFDKGMKELWEGKCLLVL